MYQCLTPPKIGVLGIAMRKIGKSAALMSKASARERFAKARKKEKTKPIVPKTTSGDGIVNNAGTDVTTVGFTGHRTHASSGLAMALYRGYDAGLGRWVSEDPILLASGRINFYEYADQQPLRLVDPLGLTSRGIVTVLTFRHLCDFHTYRNARNRCPPRDPNGGQGFTWDALFKKYRHKDGSECKYDSCGRLLPDDGNNYTYNYEPSYDTPSAFSRHVWLDVLPTFYCGAVAPGHGRTR